MNEPERRHALADFLRTRRAGLSPQDVGLPTGRRRRTPGLRREEVAQLAAIGTSWYVWLEQGRDVHPSADALEHLARALRLTPNERRHLFLLAGLSLPAPPAPTDESVSLTLRQALHDLHPTPAYVLGRRWDCLAWNEAADRVFDISGAAPPHTHNLVWKFFTDPAKRKHYPQWEIIARGALAELRAASVRYPYDDWFDDLIADLKRASAEFCQWWPHHEAPRAIDGLKTLEHPIFGHLEFDHVTLQVLSNPDLKLTIYAPHAATRATLDEWLQPPLASGH